MKATIQFPVVCHAGVPPASPRGQRHKEAGETPALRAFTLIEILVVVTIIAALIAILIPSINWAQQRANKANTTALLQSIATGLEQYYQNNQMYPPSQAGATPVLNATPPFNRGSLMLSEGLTGYLPATVDGADGPGFRTRPDGNGAIIPPYMSAGGTNWMNVPGTNQYVFADLWGHEILYYRAVPTVIGGQRRTITNIFATGSSTTAPEGVSFPGYFDANDNSVTAVPPSAPTLPNFYQLLGGSSNSNTLNAGDTILGSNSFLLISAGSDGLYFTADDIVVGGK